MPASEVVEADEHLLHAALQRRLLLHLVAELGGREFLHLDLAAALGGHHLGELLTPKLIGWSVLLRWPKRIVRSCTWAAAGVPTSAQRLTAAHSNPIRMAVSPWFAIIWRRGEER